MVQTQDSLSYFWVPQTRYDLYLPVAAVVAPSQTHLSVIRQISVSRFLPERLLGLRPPVGWAEVSNLAVGTLSGARTGWRVALG